MQNIVATSDLESDVNLNSIAVTLGLDRVEYEPEQFPGLVCRLQEPRVVVLLFGSGKLVCTGARRPSDVALAVEKITKELQAGGLLSERRGSAYAVSEPSSRSSLSSSAVPASPRQRSAAPSEAPSTAKSIVA